MTSLCSPLKREISPLDTPKEKRKALTSERESLRACSCPQRRPHCNSNNAVRSHALRAQQGNQAFLRGSASGARKRHPNLPRFACADLRYASPFPLPLSLRFKGGGYPSPCACYPHPDGRGPRRVCENSHSQTIQKPRSNEHDQRQSTGTHHKD